MIKVKVIDAICGAGKTSYAIQMMNENFSRIGIRKEGISKFIYVTPFLKEVERIVNSTNGMLHEPTGLQGSKSKHVKKLIEEEKSIVMSHELFSRLDEETLSDIEFNNYILIMDEVANVLEKVSISERDIDYLLKSNAIEIGEKGKISWIDEEYNDTEELRFIDIKNLADSENLYLVDDSVMFWTMNVKAFTSFKEVYILTYLFDGQIQKYYYDFHEVEYTKYSIEEINGKYSIVEYSNTNDERKKIALLLNVHEDDRNDYGRTSALNTNYGDHLDKYKRQFYLSSSWFISTDDENKEQLKRNLNNYFRNHVKTTNKNIFWTTKKLYAPVLKNAKCKFNKKDDRSKDNYVALNARATNDYAHCTGMAYVYNRFMNPYEKKFFETRGISINEDLLAVSDLIQFLFRGCIRKGEKMNCYIPSIRMRYLLYDWMEYKL